MITLIIPFHSDFDRIRTTIEALIGGIERYPIDRVIFSYNGRKLLPESTKKLILTSHPKICLVQTEAVGIGAGYRNGIYHATSEYVLLSASDLPFGFTDLQNSLVSGKLCPGGQTVIFASKLHPLSQVSRTSPLRSLFTWGFYLYRLMLFGPGVPRDCQGTVLLPTAIAKEMMTKIPYDDYVFTFMLSALARWNGLEVVEVPVTFIENKEFQSSIRPFRTGLEFFITVLTIRVRTLLQRPS